MTDTPSLFEPGGNCWRVSEAERAALLVDGDAYFSTLRRVAREARQTIFIVGWDVDSRILFPPGAPDDGLPDTLGPFLDALVARHDGLQVYLLNWDFVLLYALDRELLPIYNLGWRTNDRLHFHLDANHPTGGSHHQKIVVVDDTLAFVGGLDLTSARWDTPEHAPDEPRRNKPDGSPYAPFHDMQLMVEGPVAKDLGELVRRRWQRATGKQLPEPAARRDGSIWPDSVEPEFRHVGVAVARTEPAYDGAEPVQEVLQLYLDAIASARHAIYIENQYFTSQAIGDALERRLAEADGPEVVIVTRRTGGGWLEQNTMEVLRARLLRRLAPEGTRERLRVYCPEQEGLGKFCIDLHSKLMLVDDTLLRVGSANLNNRSMGFDTECDLAIQAQDAAQREAIAGIRNRLLAEHLGISADDVAQSLQQHGGSLIAAIEAQDGSNSRTLRPLEPRLDPQVDELVPEADVIDPEHPIDIAQLTEQIVPEDERPRAGRHVLGVTLVLLAMAALAIAWRWGPLSDWLQPARLQQFADTLERLPWTPVWVVGVFVVASSLGVPVTVLILATAFVFGPGATFGYALGGALLAAACAFWLGQKLGRDPVRRLAGKRLNALSRRLGEGGVFAVMVLRMLPVAPFTVVNLVAGASHLKLRDFLLGTALGMAPGILAVAVFSGSLVQVLQDPSPQAVGVLALVLVGVGAGALLIRAWLRRYSRRRADAQA